MNKKTPLRMCLACRLMMPKEELIRITRQKDGAFSLDEKAMGRGAYVCKKKECVAQCAKKKLLNRAFKTNVDDAVYTLLKERYEPKTE